MDLSNPAKIQAEFDLLDSLLAKQQLGTDQYKAAKTELYRQYGFPVTSSPEPPFIPAMSHLVSEVLEPMPVTSEPASKPHRKKREYKGHFTIRQYNATEEAIFALLRSYCLDHQSIAKLTGRKISSIQSHAEDKSIANERQKLKSEGVATVDIPDHLQRKPLGNVSFYDALLADYIQGLIKEGRPLDKELPIIRAHIERKLGKTPATEPAVTLTELPEPPEQGRFFTAGAGGYCMVPTHDDMFRYLDSLKSHGSGYPRQGFPPAGD